MQYKEGIEYYKRISVDEMFELLRKEGVARTHVASISTNDPDVWYTAEDHTQDSGFLETDFSFVDLGELTDPKYRYMVKAKRYKVFILTRHETVVNVPYVGHLHSCMEAYLTLEQFSEFPFGLPDEFVPDRQFYKASDFPYFKKMTQYKVYIWTDEGHPAGIAVLSNKVANPYLENGFFVGRYPTVLQAARAGKKAFRKLFIRKYGDKIPRRKDLEKIKLFK